VFFNMPLTARFAITLALAACAAGSAVAIEWPVGPGDASMPLGNSYGEFQYYGGDPYYHPGIDILVPAGTPVYAVKAGWVKAVLTIAADLHWRVAIGDSAGATPCDGWLYAHLDPVTIAVSEGEWVDAGQYLGDIVYWPVADFHHLHFVKIRHQGVVWSSDWQFIGNPLDELDMIADTSAPVFENGYGAQRFAFCQNGSASYFAIGEALAGDVDVVCRAYDYIQAPAWKVAPYQLEYAVEGDSSIPWTLSVAFTGPLAWDQDIYVVYQDDPFCPSMGDYEQRRFYFNLTNTDGDGVIEADDASYSWQTSYFHNGPYTVYARAQDRFGNVTVDSMTITVGNFFALTGAVGCADGNPTLGGTIVTIGSSQQTDTTDAAGEYAISMVGGGSQTVQVTRPGYLPIDTVLMMNQPRQAVFSLTPAPFLAGDANGDGQVDVGDAVFLVNFVFRDGQSPRPYLAGDANGDGRPDVGDAVYLINYIFKGGPAPHGR
jgi:hypothetical protein